MHYLITGGAGFIGGHLCEWLLDDGHDVTVLDDLSTGRRDNVDRCAANDRFQFVLGSVLDEDLLDELVGDCDAVFHLASTVGVKLIMEQPVHAIENIVGGTGNVLWRARRHRRKVVIASSSEVYGKSDAVPFEEDGDRLAGPTSKHRWAYACAKALDEFLALAHWKEARLPVVCARLFNVVGPRQLGDYGMVVPRFVAAALAGEPLIVHGAGGQTRTFCHVADVVGAIAGLMQSARADGKVVNVGSDREISIRGLAKRVVAIVGGNSPIQHISYKQAYGAGFEDMPRRVPSLKRIRELIGWQPIRDLDQIIQDVAVHLRAGHAPQ